MECLSDFLDFCCFNYVVAFGNESLRDTIFDSEDFCYTSAYQSKKVSHSSSFFFPPTIKDSS